MTLVRLLSYSAHWRSEIEICQENENGKLSRSASASTTATVPPSKRQRTDTQVSKTDRRETIQEDLEHVPRSDIRIFTFSLGHSIRQVQALCKHTLFELIDAVCTHSVIGDDETAISHLWNVRVNTKEGDLLRFESFDDGSGVRQAADTTLGMLAPCLTVGSELTLEYNYASPTYYSIRVQERVTKDPNVDSDDDDEFPRCKPVPAPAGYRPHELPWSMDECFPVLRDHLATHHCQEWSLFRNNVLRFGSALLLAAGGSDLSCPLRMWDHACGFLEEDEPTSLLVLPEEDAAAEWISSIEEDGGEVELCIVPRLSAPVQLNALFPKLAALAGYAKDPSGKIPRGWVVYREGVLRICTGPSTTLRPQYSKGSLLYGADQNEPEDPTTGTLSAMEVTNVESLTQFFCIIEGMLGTL